MPSPSEPGRRKGVYIVFMTPCINQMRFCEMKESERGRGWGWGGGGGEKFLVTSRVKEQLLQTMTG